MTESISVECNTPDAVLRHNISTNSQLPIPWLKTVHEHDGHAVIVGSGPSLKDTLDSIKWRKSLGQKIFALNGAAKFLQENGVEVDYFVMVDAREENKRFLGFANHYYIASQCAPSAFADVLDKTTLWHAVTNGMEDAIPDDRDVTFIGGGTTVGLSALCLVYALGYRKMHLFGYDSSHRNADGHAFNQSLNANDSLCTVVVDGVEYRASWAMAKQAELFPELANELIDRGCVITVDGDGLLPALVRRQQPIPEPLLEVCTEQAKYEYMWGLDRYREFAPGKQCAILLLAAASISNWMPVREKDWFIDFGAGTGAGALTLHKHFGCGVVMVDFAANCLNEEVKSSLSDKLKFHQADITAGVSLSAMYGFCTDVMEHIAPENIDKTLANIFKSAKKVFFQISTVPDNMGALIGQPLHLTVQPFAWWQEKLAAYGRVSWSSDFGKCAVFFVDSLTT